MQLYGPGVNESEAMGEMIALGPSREPPVFARFGLGNLDAKFARATRYGPKRLPSGRWAITHHINAPRPLENDDEDETSSRRLVK
jgi:hypothetical protein